MSEMIKTISGVIGITIATLSALVIVVDGVAIIFTYVSLLFALFLIGGKHRRMLKIYGVMFMIAHLVLGWRIVSDTNKNGALKGQVPMDFRSFEVCSDKMLQNIGESQVELTAENRAEFSKCMGQ